MLKVWLVGAELEMAPAHTEQPSCTEYTFFMPPDQADVNALPELFAVWLQELFKFEIRTVQSCVMLSWRADQGILGDWQTPLVLQSKLRQHYSCSYLSKSVTHPSSAILGCKVDAIPVIVLALLFVCALTRFISQFAHKNRLGTSLCKVHS